MRAVRLKRPSGKLSPPIFDEAILRRAITMRWKPLVAPIRIDEPGVSIGPERGKPEAKKRFIARLMHEPVGTHLVARDSSHRVVHGRVVQTDPKPADTSGSHGVDLLVGFLNQVFPGQWESWGVYVYKHISGSSTWSDHAYVSIPYWCGRAIDIHPHSVAVGDAIEAAAKAESAIADRLRYVLWRGVPDHYPGHLHFSFEDGGAPGRC